VTDRLGVARLQGQRDAVDAVTLVGGGRVALALEHVAKVGVTPRAPHLGADHAERAVDDVAHAVFGQQGEERGPPAVRFLPSPRLEGTGAYRDSVLVGFVTVVYPFGAFAYVVEMWLKIRSLEAGAEADWWNAIFTLCGVAAAVFAGLVGLSLFWVEFRRDDQARKDRRERFEEELRTQADLVSCWFNYDAHDLGGRLPHKMWGARILNASSGPIYNVMLEFFFPDENGIVVSAPGRQTIPVQPPSSVPDFEWPPEVIEERHGHGPRGHDRARDGWLKFTRDRTFVAITFTDTKGRRWRRDEKGRLTRNPVSQ
jgi:hypothetical protein